MYGRRAVTLEESSRAVPEPYATRASVPLMGLSWTGVGTGAPCLCLLPGTAAPRGAL